VYANKYWTNVDGERYLQVEEVDAECFLDGDEDEETGGSAAGGDDDEAKKIESDRRGSTL
jgi:hypothetical protein